MTVKKKGEELGEDGRWKKGGEGYKEGSFAIAKLTLRLWGPREISLSLSTLPSASFPPSTLFFRRVDVSLFLFDITGFSPGILVGRATRKAVFKCTNEARDQRGRRARALSESGRRKDEEKESRSEKGEGQRSLEEREGGRVGEERRRERERNVYYYHRVHHPTAPRRSLSASPASTQSGLTLV